MDISFTYPNEPIQNEPEETQSTKSEEIHETEDDQQLSEIEIEEIIRKTVTGSFKELMKNFEKQISDTSKQVKEEIGSQTKKK